jgi:4-diphosphocytidyl-2-C-methyl-D-erythritol kinase
MLFERQGDALRVRTPAKVNLFLEVLGWRPDGYHEIATLMAMVSLFDTLEIAPNVTGGLSLHCDYPGLSTGPDNLVLRAARLLRERTGCALGAEICLTKRIPLAAGLAGGSSDAAAALEGLSRLWRLRLSSVKLASLAAELGSDVPFFLAGPAAWCTGRGEKTTSAPIKGPLHFVLACPPIGLSTAEAYGAVTVPELPLDGQEIRRAVADGNVNEIGRNLFNRLQRAAEELCPAVAETRERLEALRPAGVLMSGSGTSVFALCRDHHEALRVAHGLSAGPRDPATNPRVHVVQSCD